jgi:hypothetical protein
MGVDYTGHYGIGIEVECIDFDDENLSSEVAELEVMCEFLDTKLDGSKYGWFEVGQGSYTGEQDDCYIKIKEPFADGYAALEQKKQELLKHIEEIGLKPKGEFGLIGGMQMW